MRRPQPATGWWTSSAPPASRGGLRPLVHRDHLVAGGILRTTSAVGVTSGLWLATWVLPGDADLLLRRRLLEPRDLRRDEAPRRDRPARSFAARLARLAASLARVLRGLGVVDVALHLLDVGAPTGPRLWGGTRCSRVPAAGPDAPVRAAVVPRRLPGGRRRSHRATIWLHRRFRWWVPAFMLGRRRRRRRRRVRPRALGVSAGSMSPSCCCSRTSWGTSTATARSQRLPRRCSGRWSRRASVGLVLLTTPAVLAAVRRSPVRLVPRDRRTTRRACSAPTSSDLERLSADAVLPARGHLDDRGRDVAAPVSPALAAATPALEGDDRRERA